jgi:TolB-like protein/tetratricopeptide (TPR) repeat protein
MLIALAVVVTAGLLAWRMNTPTVSSPAARSIAVLPIRNLTGDASKNYLADGLTEVLISNLARVRALRVPSFSAVLPFRDSSEPSRTIAEKLGAHILLAGSVATAGDSVRLGVQLIDPATDTVQWSEELTRPASQLLSAQGEIATLVAARLSVGLTTGESRGLRQQPLNPAAQDAFLRGLVALHPGADLNTATSAVAHFQRAVSLEPGFAPAWAHLALAELRLVDRVSAIDRVAKAAEIATMAEKAIEIDPTLEAGYLALGTTQFYHDWSFATAEQTLRAGLERSPSSAVSMQRLASLLSALGRMDEAIGLGEASRSLEPLVPLRSTSLGTTYYYARDFARAEAEMKRALEIQPGFVVGHFGLARVYSAMGRHHEAIQQAELALSPARTPAYLAEAARVYQAAGRPEMTAATVRELDDRKRQGEAYSADNLAYIAAAAGRIDEAFAILDSAVQQRLTNVLWIGVDPRADPLRGDPRFTALLKRIGVQR